MTDIHNPDFALWADENPIVSEAVEQAVAPYAGMFPPARLNEMRAALADMLVMHPTTSALIASLTAGPARQKSGKEPIGEAAETMESAVPKKATGSGT